MATDYKADMAVLRTLAMTLALALAIAGSPSLEALHMQTMDGLDSSGTQQGSCGRNLLSDWPRMYLFQVPRM